VAKSVLEDKDVIGTNAKNQINHKDVQKFEVENSKHSWHEARSQWKQWKLEESEKRCKMLQTHPADKLFILYIIIHFTPVQHLSLRSLIEESSDWQCHNLSNTATKISTAISLNIREHL
jgi:hypothetical protein